MRLPSKWSTRPQKTLEGVAVPRWAARVEGICGAHVVEGTEIPIPPARVSLSPPPPPQGWRFSWLLRPRSAGDNQDPPSPPPDLHFFSSTVNFPFHFAQTSDHIPQWLLEQLLHVSVVKSHPRYKPPKFYLYLRDSSPSKLRAFWTSFLLLLLYKESAFLLLHLPNSQFHLLFLPTSLCPLWWVFFSAAL